MIMLQKSLLTAVFLIALSTITSCVTTPGGLTSSASPVDVKKTIINLGPSEGVSNSSWTVLNLWTVNKADIDIAINDAIQKKGGDALINVRWYTRDIYAVLFILTRVIVIGDVIKYEMITEESPAGKPVKKR